MRKVITIIFLLLTLFAVISCTKSDMAANTERIELIESHLKNTYQGDFILVSDEPIVSNDNKTSYGYRFATDDDRQIEFTAYYNKDSLFDRTPHMASDLDYAIAEYVVANSEFGAEYDITNMALEQVTEKLYQLAAEEQRILEDYGQTWFTPLLKADLLYDGNAIEFYFKYTGSKESIYSGLLYEVRNIDEHYHEEHDHDEHD